MSPVRELLDKHDIKHGIENDQARLDAFVRDIENGVYLAELRARVDENSNWRRIIKHGTGFIGKGKFTKRIIELDNIIKEVK